MLEFLRNGIRGEPSAGSVNHHLRVRRRTDNAEPRRYWRHVVKHVLLPGVGNVECVNPTRDANLNVNKIGIRHPVLRNFCVLEGSVHPVEIENGHLDQKRVRNLLGQNVQRS